MWGVKSMKIIVFSSEDMGSEELLLTNVFETYFVLGVYAAGRQKYPGFKHCPLSNARRPMLISLKSQIAGNHCFDRFWPLNII